MENELCIRNTKKKCSACGKRGEGLLVKSVRYENLTPVFLCRSCIEALSSFAKDRKEGEK